MSDDYLWDRSGDPEPDIVTLEQTLAPLRHDGRPFDPAVLTPAPRRSVWRRTLLPVALAASVVLAVGSLWPGPGPAGPAWTVDSLDGTVSVSGRPAVAQRLAAGDRIETGPDGRVRLSADGVGTLTLGPRARLTLTRVGPDRHWFALDMGSLDADISAAPGVFAVDTPSSRAVDLGCRYTLDVGADGAGLLRVTLGWVGLARDGRESLVPAGAMCTLRAGGGPGTPHFDDASPAFVHALAAVDRGNAAERAFALPILLAESRREEAIALWHLLTRLDREAAEQVYGRLAEVVRPPAGVTREATLAADPAALAAWWEAIGLGDLNVLRAGMLRVPSPSPRPGG